MNRILGPLLAVLLLAGVAWAIWWSSGEKSARDAAEAVEEVRILAGSESLPFLEDAGVQAVLAKHGLHLVALKSGSREIALRADLKQFDAAYPSGVPAAEKIRQATGAKQAVSTFYTPMVVASWKALVPVLEANGLVKKRGEAWYLIDMQRLFRMMGEGARWRDLKDNTAFAVGKSLLVATTDVRKSNSAAQYLALASWVANGGNVVASDEDVDRVMPLVEPLFVKQGYQESSSAGPFENYLAMGMGAVPLVMVYEAQYLEYQLRGAAHNPETVLLYPEPTVFTKRVMVPLSPRGEKLARLLAEDADIARIAAGYGLRSADASLLAAALAAKKLPPAPQLTDVIEPPTFEMLEKMITRLEARMH